MPRLGRFIEAAEESSRSTFESIEAFVSVFTSISQMMESTYMLVHRWVSWDVRQTLRDF